MFSPQFTAWRKTLGFIMGLNLQLDTTDMDIFKKGLEGTR